MARIKKYSPEQKLSSFQTLILDENPNSDYFRITEFKDTFTGGKNGFLIEGSEYLKETTEVKIELLDVEGNPIYFEPGNGIPEYYEGISKLIAVYIYNDTPIGLGKITILGELKQYEDNGVIRDIPDQWKGSYNVKWERTFQINQLLSNEDKVRFYRRPEVNISEIVKPIFSGNPPSVTQSGSVDGIPLVPLAGSNISDFILPTSYRLKVNSGNKWTGSVEGEKITFDNITYSPTIEEIVNETEIVVSPPYVENNIVTSFTNEDYSVEFPYIEGVGDLATSLTGSFAKISITNMKTFVGDAARVKVFRRSQNNLTDFEFVQEIQLESNELLRDITTFAKKEEPYGFFSQTVLDDYWVTSSIDFDVAFNQNFLYNSAKLNSTPTNFFFTSESFDIQSGVEYTLDLNVRKETTDPNAYLKVFLSGSYNGKGVQQQIVNLPSTTGILQKTNFNENIVANNFDNAELYFEVSGSDWYVNNVSLKASQETSFSPDEITFIQQVPKLLVQETFDYRFEFYDINNNYIPITVEDTKTFSGGNTNLFEKSIELSPNNLYFSFDSASNPANAVPPLSIAIDVDTTLVTGSIVYTSGAFDFFGNLLSSSQYAGGIYPGYLTNWDVDGGREPFLRVQDFTGSRDDISVQFIRYTGAIEGVSDTFTISRVEDGKGGVSFEIVPFRGVQIKNKESKTLEIQAVRVDGINRINLRAGLEKGFSDAKLHLLSSSLDGATEVNTYVSLSQAITNPNFIEGISAGTTGSGEIDYNATFTRDAIDNELTVYLMDGPISESILTSQILTDLKDGLNPGLITSTADQFNIKYKPREAFSFDPAQSIITSSFQQRGSTLNPLTANLVVTPSASIEPLTELPELFVFYDTGAFDDTIEVAVTDFVGNSINSGVPGISVPYYTAVQTKQLNFEFTYTEPITSASVTANKTFFITPDGLPGQNSIVIDIDPNPVSLGSNHKGDVVNYSLADTDVQITQGDLFLINTGSGNPGTFTTTSIVPTNIVFETLVGDSTTTMSLAGFETMSALSASVQFDFNIFPYFTSSLVTASKTQKFTKVVDGGGPIEVTLDPIANALNADEIGFVSDYSSATTEVFIKQNDEFFFYDEFDSGRPGTFVTESITTTNIQFSEMSSSFDDLSVSGSISSSGGEILHFKGFSGLANNQPSASILYNFKVYPYSLTGGVAGIPRTVSKTQTFSKVSDGTAARKVSLVASSDVIVYDGDGIKVAPSGDVTLTATAINVSGSAFFTFLNNDGSTIQASSGDSTTTVGDLPATGSTKTFKVELRDGLATGTIVDTDSVTISGISEGATVYTAQLSNPASSVTVEVDGTTFFENTPTLIRAYKGGVELEFTEVYDEEAVDPTTFLPIGTFGQFSSSIHQISTYLTHNGGKVDATASELFGTSDGISNWNAPQQNTQGFIIFKVDFENGRGEQFIQQSFSAVFEGATGPGLVMRGEWTGSIDYIFDQGAKRRDAVFRDISGDVHYWGTTQAIPSGSEYLDLDNVYTLEPIYTSSTTQGDVDVNGWQYLGIQDFFVAAKLAIFEESFVKNTINVGTPPSGNPNAQIAIVGGTDEPYIAVGQTGVQGYGQEGVFIGMSNDSGSNGTTGILSLTSDASSGTYNQLAWDGDTLLIKGAIRQTAEGVVESRNLGLWDSTPASFSFRVGDIVSNENITWECILVHVKGVGNDEPGVGSSYTTYWEESNLAAKSVRLSADTQIFRVAQDGTITPSTITLTANRQNIGSPTSYTSVPSIVSGSTGDTATITPAQFGSNTSVTLTAAAGGFEDDMTIVKLQEGTDAITVVNSNQSHTLQTSEAGTVTYTDSGTTIQVFEGATALNFTTGFASPGIFTITTSASNISASTPSGNATDTATFGVHNSMNASQASIVYTIAGQKANGDTFTITTTQSFSKAIAGTSAETMRLSADGQSFVEGTNGVLTPDFIKFTANRENIGTTTSWTTSPSVTLYDASTGGSSTTTGDIVYLRKVDFGANTSITVTATAGGKSDEITVVRLTDGSNAITTILSNEAHTLNATSAGVVSDFTNSGTELVAYEGANQLTFQKPNTIVTNKLFRGLSLDTHDDGDDGFQFLGGALASGTTADITNIWNVLAQLGVLWVYDYDSHGDYFTFNGSTQSDSAKVQSVTYVSGTTYKVTLASNYEMSGPSEENAFNFQFAAYDTDSAYQILTGALTTTLASSEFTIEFALYKGFTGAQFPSISGDNTKTGIVGDLTAFSNTIDNGFIAYVLKHIKANGEVVRTVKKQSFSKSKAGSDGAPGSGGAGVTYRGNWANDASVIYNSSDVRKDVVKFNGDFYIANFAAADTFAGNLTPPNSTYWATFGAQFESVATDILFAEDVYANRTINIGTDSAGSPVIALNADSSSGYINPFISIGQEAVSQSFGEEGLFLGYSLGKPALSMVNGNSFMSYDVTGSLRLSDVPLTGTGSSIIGAEIKVGRNPNIGIGNPGDYNFKVSTDGVVSASAAFIQGQIQADSGQIGDWRIDSTTRTLRDDNSEIIFDPNLPEIQLYKGTPQVTTITNSITASVVWSDATNQYVITGTANPPFPSGEVGGGTQRIRQSRYVNKFNNATLVELSNHDNGTLAHGGYYFDMSDSTLAADTGIGGHPAHYLAFSTTQDGTHGGGSEYNHPTSLPATYGGTSQGFLIISSSEAPGTAGSYVQIHYSASMDTELPSGKLHYYNKHQAGAGGEVLLSSVDFTETTFTDLTKKVSIGVSDTLRSTVATSDTFAFDGFTYSDVNVTNDSTTILSAESSAKTIGVGDVVLDNIEIPLSKIKASGITNSGFTVANPNYPPSYDGEIHGGILAQNGGTKGTRQITQRFDLVDSDDNVVNGSFSSGEILRTQIVYGAKSAINGYVGNEEGFESVIGETEITLEDGSTKLAKDITLDDKILAWDEKNNKFTSANLSKISKRDVSNVYEVKVDNKVIQVSDSHGFWLFGDDTNSAKVLASDLYKHQNNEELSRVWVKDGDTIKKCNITYIKNIKKDTEVITFSVPGYVNYISNDIISHNVFGGPGFELNWVFTAFAAAVLASNGGNFIEQAATTTDIVTTSTYGGDVNARYRTTVTATGGTSISVSAAGVLTTTTNSTTANFGIADSGNNVVISIPGANTGGTLYGQDDQTVLLSSNTNFVEIQPAGMQIVSDSSRFVTIPLLAAGSANTAPIFKANDGIALFSSRKAVSATSSTDSTDRASIASAGDINPVTNNTYTLGNSSFKWKELNGLDINGLQVSLATGPVTTTGTSYTNSSSTNYDSYVVLPGGFIMQFGYIYDTSSPRTVSFPTTFPTALLSAGCSTVRSSNGGNGYNHVYNLSRSRMDVILDGDRGFWWAYGK